MMTGSCGSYLVNEETAKKMQKHQPDIADLLNWGISSYLSLRISCDGGKSVFLFLGH